MINLALVHRLGASSGKGKLPPSTVPGVGKSGVCELDADKDDGGDRSWVFIGELSGTGESREVDDVIEDVDA